MGHGIAQVAATAGYETRLTDADPAARERALRRIAENLEGAVRRGRLSPAERAAALGRLRWYDRVEDAAYGAALVIEAIVEQLPAKLELFRRLDLATTADAVLATNTSALPVTRIAAVARHAERVVGMHFFNPVHIMKLVEIVTHDRAAPATIERVREIAVRMGKEPIVVRDTPGFATSRLGVVLGLEAIRMLEQGVASAGDIDRAMELGYNHPMGPLRLTDVVGLDVRLAIAEHLHDTLGGDTYCPPQLLRDKVARGELGKKTGQGFYRWENER